MSSRTHITKFKFHTINHDLKLEQPVSQVAKAHGVSYETVRKIKVAKTWPKYEAMKLEKNKRRTTGISLGESVRNASKSLAEAKLDAVVQSPLNQIHRDENPEIKIVTLEEWRGMNRWINTLSQRIDQMAKKQRSKRWWVR
ncbi:hypothetical protein [Arthrobacter sp. EpRS71]|uniref:hypothetical protein n=1 Tax=Arthrobacter sp. EpRS71 TaxID=1743141 RepID=UPI00074ABE95|nr:hypothetical protein [Arthrobacter sp. EpRS71]KUM38991.1 hypothetical protein AR689_07505 [Arthrobacter sp. EpRS71]